tara:strand:- start:4548 stop:4730 length:183 start_codon:yes stop_codon:yes gene_type:complete
MKGVNHYKKNGIIYKGKTHKMPNGQLHSGAQHSKGSVKLYHFSGLSKKSKAKAKSQWGKK